MHWIDTHCHLDFAQFADHRDKLLAQLQACGFAAVINPAVLRQDWATIAQLCSSYSAQPKLLAAYGLHPCFYTQHQHEDLVALDQWLKQSKAVAVGEIGLDLAIAEPQIDRQLALFDQQLDIASAAQLPVILHIRRAHAQALALLKAKNFAQGGVIHAYTGSTEQAKQYLQLGFVVGLGGAVTYANSTKVQKMVKALPDDGFVLETDAPDMSPAFAKGQVNTPLNLPKMGKVVAQLRQQTLEQVRDNTAATACKIFRLSA